MAHHTPEHEILSTNAAVTRIVDWWQDGRPGGDWATATGQPSSQSAEVLRRVHQCVQGSWLVDAAGLSADAVLARALELANVDAAGKPFWEWTGALEQATAGQLILISDAHLAGATRRSAEPERVLERVARLLRGQGAAGVVVGMGSESSAEDGRIGIQLSDPSGGLGNSGATPAEQEDYLPPEIHALAYSEPRIVPVRAWMALATAVGITADENRLTELARRHPNVLAVHEGGVAFINEGLPAQIRANAPEGVMSQVNHHMVTWLMELAPELRHPAGWAASGTLGQYAATGLAMHAVQAGVFDALLDDGSVLANIPQAALMDAAHCAYEGAVTGSNSAGDAMYLWMYGVKPSTQSEWAAWLHLMATARQDDRVTLGIEASGIRLPWTTHWTNWRPPGGYHMHYLDPGPVGGLAEVRWHGRPAVATTGEYEDVVFVWDAATGEKLAGPWFGDQFPDEHQGALTWPGTRTSDAESGPSAPLAGPSTLAELEAACQWDGGPDPDFLPCTMEIAATSSELANEAIRTVVGGHGGLFAVRVPDTEGSARFDPCTGPPPIPAYSAADAAVPRNTPPPEPQDLAVLFGSDCMQKFSTRAMPTGLLHPATRHALAHCGLPIMDEQGLSLWGPEDGALGEVVWPTDVPPVTESGPFFRLGMWMGGAVVVDGPTGHILRIPSRDEDGLEGALVASGVEAFFRMIGQWIVGHRILAVLTIDDEAHLLRQEIECALTAIDERGARSGAWTYGLYNG